MLTRIIIDSIPNSFWEDKNSIYHTFSFEVNNACIAEYKEEYYVIEDWDYDDWSEEFPEGGWDYGTRVFRMSDWKYKDVDTYEPNPDIDDEFFEKVLEDGKWYDYCDEDEHKEAKDYYKEVLNEHGS